MGLCCDLKDFSATKMFWAASVCKLEVSVARSLLVKVKNLFSILLASFLWILLIPANVVDNVESC